MKAVVPLNRHLHLHLRSQLCILNGTAHAAVSHLQDIRTLSRGETLDTYNITPEYQSVSLPLENIQSPDMHVLPRWRRPRRHGRNRRQRPLEQPT